jgi:hypothetical protein
MSKEGILSILSKKIERSDSTLRHSSFDFSEFLFRLDRSLFWPAAGLTPETRHLTFLPYNWWLNFYKSTDFRTKRRKRNVQSFPYLPITHHHKFGGCQFFHSHGPESVKLGGADTDFSTQPQLSAVIKPR